MKVLTYTLPHTKTQIKNHCHYFLHIPIQRNMTWHHIRVCCLSLLDCWGRRSRIRMFPLRHHELFLLGSLKKFDNAVCTGFSRCRNFSGRTPRFTTWTFIITWINHHRLNSFQRLLFCCPYKFQMLKLLNNPPKPVRWSSGCIRYQIWTAARRCGWLQLFQIAWATESIRTAVLGRQVFPRILFHLAGEEIVFFQNILSSKFMKHMIRHRHLDLRHQFHTLQHGPIHVAGQAVWSGWVSCFLTYVIVASNVEAAKPKSFGFQNLCGKIQEFLINLWGLTNIGVIWTKKAQ